MAFLSQGSVALLEKLCSMMHRSKTQAQMNSGSCDSDPEPRGMALPKERSDSCELHTRVRSDRNRAHNSQV